MGARPLALAKFKQMALRLKGVPVLLYHELSAAAEPRLAAGKDRYLVSADQFRSHLELIRQHSYRVISLQDLWDSAPDSRDGSRSARRASAPTRCRPRRRGRPARRHAHGPTRRSR